ncbi:MAG TPA: tetratricopeptide repeat protein, partial [Candidatus Dormibacteraeota bacterium]
MRLRNAFDYVHAGRPYTPIPTNIDEFNDVELPTGAGVSLDEAASRADAELASLIQFTQAIGERPFKWDLGSTSTEAVLRNSYVHPQNHIAAYLTENGDKPAAYLLLEQAAQELRDASAPDLILGAALCNLAVARVEQRRLDGALDLFDEGLRMRPDLRAVVQANPDLAVLNSNPRFQSILGVSP